MKDDNVTRSIAIALNARTDPADIGVGVPFLLTLGLVSDDATDLTGNIVDICDGKGQVLASTKVTRPDASHADGTGSEAADTHQTELASLTAPLQTGETDWHAVLRDPDAAPGEGLSIPLKLQINAHVIGLSVWDIPQALHPKQEFTFKVGLSCADGCDTSGWVVGICDGDGALLTEATMGDEAWRSTPWLRFAQVLATAPEGLGRYEWTARAVAPAKECEHAHATGVIRLNVTPKPEFRICVEAIDSVTGQPLKGAKVFAHPYGAVADENGVAELMVHGGDYRLFVSGPAHVARRFDASVSKNLSFRAALIRDEGFTDADLW